MDLLNNPVGCRGLKSVLSLAVSLPNGGGVTGWNTRRAGAGALVDPTYGGWLCAAV
ncbi:MAG: hypothetical protein LBG05_10820 [Treponema sp.]|nr:hypothetical protein [Treponema sp.]